MGGQVWNVTDQNKDFGRRVQLRKKNYFQQIEPMDWVMEKKFKMADV